jgi:MFS family permease
MALLTNYMGWRHAMLLDAGLGLVIFAAIFLLVKDYPPHAADKQKEDQANIKNLGLWKGLQLVFLNPQNWFGGIYTALMNLPVFLLGAIWGIHYLTEVHHVTVLQASYVTTFFFIGVIFGAPFFGWLSDYMSRRIFPMTLGAIMSLIVILLIIFMPYLSLKELMLLFFLIGFVTSSQVLSYPTIAELNSPILTSSAISIVSITIMASGVIFQPLFGWLMELGWDHTIVDNVPIYSASNFLHAMLIMPCAFIIGFFIAFMIKETYCRAKG